MESTSMGPTAGSPFCSSMLPCPPTLYSTASSVLSACALLVILYSSRARSLSSLAILMFLHSANLFCPFCILLAYSIRYRNLFCSPLCLFRRPIYSMPLFLCSAALPSCFPLPSSTALLAQHLMVAYCVASSAFQMAVKCFHIEQKMDLECRITVHTSDEVSIPFIYYYLLYILNFTALYDRCSLYYFLMHIYAPSSSSTISILCVLHLASSIVSICSSAPIYRYAPSCTVVYVLPTSPTVRLFPSHWLLCLLCYCSSFLHALLSHPLYAFYSPLYYIHVASLFLATVVPIISSALFYTHFLSSLFSIASLSLSLIYVLLMSLIYILLIHILLIYLLYICSLYPYLAYI